jgi:hypothetical protein
MRKYLIYIIFSFATLCAQWSTSDTGKVVVDDGSLAWLCVDPNDGSVIVTYLRDDGVYAKKFNSAGYPQWGGQRVRLATINNFLQWELTWELGEEWARLISDGQGGAVMLWIDYRNSTPIFPDAADGNELYLQRVDADGNVLYGEGGMLISSETATGFKSIETMHKDNNGGYILAFTDYTNEAIGFLRRYSWNGEQQWEYESTDRWIFVNTILENGTIFASYSHISTGGRVKLDIDGNEIWNIDSLGWIPGSSTIRSGGTYLRDYDGVIGVTAKPLNVNGVTDAGLDYWENDIVLDDSPNHKVFHSSDGLGGIYVQYRINDSIYVSHISADGDTLTPWPGAFLADSGLPQGVALGLENSVWAIWTAGCADSGYGCSFVRQFDYYGNPKGEILTIHRAPSDTYWYQFSLRVFSDLEGGFYYMFKQPYISIKRMNANGYLSTAENQMSDIQPDHLVLFPAYPNPGNNRITLPFYQARAGQVELNIFNSLGQRVLHQSRLFTGTGKKHWRLELSHLASGAYFYRLGGSKGLSTKTGKFLLIK